MFDLHWSPSEKKIARDIYERVLATAEAKLVAELKTKASAAASFSDMWGVEDWLREERKYMAGIFDYRYSRLPLFFSWAIRAGHMDERALSGLSEDKLKVIRRIARD
ncbi:Uncharacterised protein [uncultured archaeon]|nr:Uncharacterised protein [uncultured archaeon]